MKMTAILTLAAALALAVPVVAKPLSVASGAPEGSTMTEALRDVADYLGDKTDLEPEIYAMSLLSFPEMSSGIRDGMADVGMLLTVYFPAEYAATNMAANLSMLATSGTPTEVPGLAMAAAMTEYVMLECDTCQAEFKRQNQVFLGGSGSSEYVMLCTTPVRNLADMQGKKIRTGAGNYDRWVERLGAVKVTMPGNEIYEGLGQGAIDCALVSAPELINFQLIEVTDYVTQGVPGGVFAGTGVANMNLDTWRGLSPEEREAMLHAGAVGTASISQRYQDAAGEALEKARAKGIEIIDAAADLRQATAEFVEADKAAVAEVFKSTYGLEGTEAAVSRVEELVAKWKDLVAPVAGDRDAFAALLWTEVFSKVDPDAYGM
ncbi:MAG: C4-dicarboxylate TRAP transporter substrate-binding protein [Sagittula sp.]|uniref:C4-dicarboxylate TRAP transporter substrate-binding protein n=1 Tax=Sagittula sp. TaxID=2038081 RepID=UPI004057E8CC